MALGITASASLLGHGSTSFTVDSHDEGNQAVLVSFFIKAENAKSLTFIDKTFSSSNSGGTTVNLGSSTQAGDIAILFDAVTNEGSTEMPATVTPSGFTSVHVTEVNASNEFKTNSSFKILEASDITAGTITGMTAEDASKVLFTFRPGSTPTLTSGSVNTFTSNSNPSAQTVDLSSVGNHPVMVCAIRYVRSGQPTSDRASLNGSSGFTFELTSGEYAINSSRHMLRGAVYINNHGVYNELVNTNIKDILLYNSFNSSSVGAFNSVTQKTFLSPPNSTKFTISNNTFTGTAASSTGKGNEGATSNTVEILAQTSLEDGNPRLLGYNSTLFTDNASLVETNIGTGTWHDYLTASYWNTLSVEFYFFLGSNSNTGASFPRIFSWGDPNVFATNTGAMGFGFEFGGSSDTKLDVFLYVDEDNSHRTQLINTPGLNTVEWYYVFLGVDKANGTCNGTLHGRNTLINNNLTPTGDAAITSSWTPKDFPIIFGNTDSSKVYNGGVCDFIVRMDDPNYAHKTANASSGQTSLDALINGLTD